MRGTRHLWAFMASLLLASSPVGAQGTALVPLDDPAYRHLDRLAELGLADSATMGQRPYSYRELARLARAARDAANRPTGNSSDRTIVDSILDRLDARLQRVAGVRSALLDELVLGLNATDAVRRAPPPAGSASAPQATIDPLAIRRLGAPLARGGSAYVELLQRVEPTPWLALRARERFTASDRRDGAGGSRRSELFEASGRARWRNVALVVGREQLAWGSGSVGGLFLAADAPALDQLSLASDHPFALPGFLGRLGLVSGMLILAEMGPSSVRSKSKMLAYKFSAKPVSSLELGATFQNHFGGEGGRRSSFRYRVIDFLPVIDIFRRHNYVDTTVVFDVDSDKAIGMDARWRLDGLGGVTIAGEILVDDFDVHRLGSLFAWAASHALTITIPEVGSPAWSVRLGATHMDPLTYTHSVLTQGMTTHGRLLGNELGPDAKSFSAELRWIPAQAMTLSVESRVSIYSNAGYAASYNRNGRWVVEKVGAAPDELREQAIAAISVDHGAATSLTVRGGLGRTRNIMFLGGRRRSFVADIDLRWRP